MIIIRKPFDIDIVTFVTEKLARKYDKVRDTRKPSNLGHLDAKNYGHFGHTAAIFGKINGYFGNQRKNEPV